MPSLECPTQHGKGVELTNLLNGCEAWISFIQNKKALNSVYTRTVHVCPQWFWMCPVGITLETASWMMTRLWQDQIKMNGASWAFCETLGVGIKRHRMVRDYSKQMELDKGRTNYLDTLKRVTRLWMVILRYELWWKIWVDAWHSRWASMRRPRGVNRFRPDS